MHLHTHHPAWLTLVAFAFALTLIAGCGRPEGTTERLAWAIRTGKLKELEQLQKTGLDFTQPFPNGSSALHLAVRSPHPKMEIVELILAKGVDVNLRDDDGKTAWDLLWKGGRSRITKTSGLLLAALIQADFHPDQFNLSNNEPFLHAMAKRCHSTLLVKLLADRNPDIEITDENGWTALYHAAFAGNYEAAEGLLMAGANPNSKSTVEIRKSFMKGETSYLQQLYQAESHPMNLYHKTHSRFTPDFKELMLKYGGTMNSNIQNKFTTGTGIR